VTQARGRPGTATPADMPGRIVDSEGRAKAYRPLSVERRHAAREAGLAAYAEGRFFEAHELLEPAWMGSAVAAERDLDQGLIKLAAAFVHAERGNPLGMHKNLEGARKRLRAVVDGGQAGSVATRQAGVDARELLGSVETALARLEASRGSGSDRRLLELVPPPGIPRR
jgi:predicted metal-dependent hydrolase